MNLDELAIKQHLAWNGKLDIVAKAHVNTKEDLSIAYTPGVAAPCREIAENEEEVYRYTMKGNTVAVVTDGSAVLGLGNIGPKAALPVMEGKCVLFREFGGVNAFPICLDTQDTDELVKMIIALAPGFGGINLEDIAAPRCFEIEQRVQEALDIPVFHDDQHGTAIVVLSGILNALRIVKKERQSCSVVINGAGSAGIAIAKLLYASGFSNITLCDRAGIVSSQSPRLNDAKREILRYTNLSDRSGSLADAMQGADIVIGVSSAGVISPEMVSSMNDDAILFALANPIPEIMPDLAKSAGARIIGTGRSDFANQVNNVLAFPGIFKGALEGRAPRITERMKLAAATAIASLISDEELREDYVICEPFDPRIAPTVAEAVKANIEE
ncbi:MAG: NADP-dependent malic enzyme [Lachnospiraceae bacterium]|nr:NADP-dependent malic enzyme [Lachnospiraceae bacterium]